MTMESFFELYKMWAEGSGLSDEELAKPRTFANVYESWKHVLKMREVSQHARPLMFKSFKI